MYRVSLLADPQITVDRTVDRAEREILTIIREIEIQATQEVPSRIQDPDRMHR